MIISDNPKPSLSEFSALMRRTDNMLNADAASREDYYCKRGGHALEKDVYSVLCNCAKNTPFENTIQLISGASFPDIIADKLYGVEVKSTEKDHWTSIGSSILESTRNQDVERIYLTFGKLGKPVKFLSRPYEECLCDIAVTHYPRYRIDMRLKKGETIFDKMGIDYDTLRKLENPVDPVSKYYKSTLKEGESLWWAGGVDGSEIGLSPKVKLWTSLAPSQKNELVAKGYALFPELMSPSSKKYNRFALWLVTNNGIVNTNVRDGFSAGGQVPMKTRGGIEYLVPAAYGRIQKYKNLIEKEIYDTDESVLKEYWRSSAILSNRIKQWAHLINKYDISTNIPVLDVLDSIFPDFQI